MKKKRILLFALIMSFIFTLALIPNTYAAETKELNISVKRPYSDDDGNGIVGDDVYLFERKHIGVGTVYERVFKIYDISKTGYPDAFYCLRGGLGFGNSQSIESLINNKVTYTKVGNMKTEVASILNSYNLNTSKNLDNTYSTTIESKQYSFSPYNAILWLADNMYLPKHAEAANMKESLLKAAGIENSELTDDDIEVAQQLAFWYFSNYDTKGEPLSYSINAIIGNKATMSDYIYISDEGDDNTNGYPRLIFDNTTRDEDFDDLYIYYINNAIKNSSRYGTNGNNRELKVKVPTINIEETNPEITQEDSTILVGPFNITGSVGENINTNILVELFDAKEVKINHDNGRTIFYKVVRNNEETTEEISDQVGKGQFYIRIKSSILAMANTKYDLSKIKLKLSYNYDGYDTTATLWTAGNTNQPVILVNKTPLKGSDEYTIITEKLTGEFNLKILKKDDDGSFLKNARFTVEDATRTALILNDNANGQFSTDKIQITEKGQEFIYTITETKVPDGYTGLASSIRIKITTKENTEKTAFVVDKAEIIDSNGNKTTINGVILEVDERTNTIILTVENKKIKYFDLALRKYITKVNNEALVENNSRKPDIVELELKEGESTTATYNHKKSPVEVKTDDIVTYRITVYNEGEIDGRAKQVIDQLPEGLEFIEVVSGNYTANYDEETNRIVFSETEQNQNLLAYDGNNLNSTTIEINCRVIATVTTNNQILTNVAWISEDYNVLNNETTDRDSSPKSSLEVNKDNMTDYSGNGNNKTDLSDSKYYYEGQEDDDDFEKIVLKGKYFDLALRKYITKVERDGEKVTIQNARELNNIDVSAIATTGTAIYNHRKDPIEVETGDIVTYTFRVYNENDIIGYVKSITDYLPKGVEFVETQNFISKEDWQNYYSDKSNEDSPLSKKYVYEYDEETRKLTITQQYDLRETTTNEIRPYPDNYLFKLLPFDSTHANGETWINGLNYGELDIKLKVTAQVNNKNQVLTNIATMNYVAEGINPLKDNDSTGLNEEGDKFNLPTSLNTEEIGYSNGEHTIEQLSKNEYFEGQEDDDDFEKIIIKGQYFDLSLRKFITAVNGEVSTEDDSREPTIDTALLKTGSSTTAKYAHPKNPIVVKKGDIVTYKIRVYNEGRRDGYATEISDYIPEGLGVLLNYNTNLNNLWHIDETATTKDLVGDFYSSETNIKNLKITDFTDIENLSDVKIAVGNIKITTAALNDDIIKAYNKNIVLDDIEGNEKWQQSINGQDGLYYQEVEVACIVLEDNTYTGTLTNIAEISKAEDSEGNEILVQGDDIDSIPNNVDTENYNPPEDNSSYQEDDDDYEPLVLRYFDLALRKFITKIEDTEVTTRIPEVSVDKDGNVTYNHDKTPLYVANSDVVTYTIRIYNEGSIDGYAEIVSDDIPKGLKFLPSNEINKKYMWEMYYEENGEFVETDDIEKATSITTTYLSEANGKTTNIITDEGTKEENSNLLKAFDRTTMDIPDYRDVQVAFMVVAEEIPETNTSRIIINKAQISEDSDDDEDSIPDEWNEGEDDQDKEYVYVKKFDLSLLKWVTKSIVTVDGKTTTTETGFTPNIGKTAYTTDTFKNIRNNELPEPIAKVEVDRKKLNSTTVKFVYKIRVTNEGELEGYATEITDYIPDGLEFIAEDNPLWQKVGDNKVTTRALETTLLKPGESAELEIVFRWINGENNLGQKKNVAEISEDYNEKDEKDIDSNPDTVKRESYDKEIEDDDDYALVLLSLQTGGNNTVIGYSLIGLVSLTILTIGVIAIKRYVL